MVSKQKTENDHLSKAKELLLAAAVPHVPFDGWSPVLFKTAVSDSGVDAALAHVACPHGALDLAVEFHKQGDRKMVSRMQSENLNTLRYRDRIMAGVRFRLEAVQQNKEIVQRGVTLFALPMHLAQGSALIWETSDLIWKTLGDTSEDVNWYTKRATLSAVYSATVLYWLGDQSENHSDTWAFLDRRIDNVMGIEKLRSQFRKTPLYSVFMKGPGQFLSRITAPAQMDRGDLPGYVTPKE